MKVSQLRRSVAGTGGRDISRARATASWRKCGCSACLREALGLQAVVEDLFGIAGGLLAYRLVLDAESAAQLPIPPECRIDVLVDPALAGKCGIGLLIAFAQLAGDRLLVDAGLDPAHRCRAGAGGELEAHQDAGRRAEASCANDHSNNSSCLKILSPLRADRRAWS